MRQIRAWAQGGILLGALIPLTGCDPGTAATPDMPPPVPAERATHFDPATVGGVRGRVRWEGTVPVVADFDVVPIFQGVGTLRDRTRAANPAAPVIHPANRGVAGAVVFLRGVDPRRARPWDLPPVRVELAGRRFHVRQGDASGLVGVVRTGDTLVVESRDPVHHGVQARGAVFASYTLPDPGDQVQLRFPQPGIVELTSPAGYYWMRAFLFVADHPYYARTDSDGRFHFEQVPPGPCEVVAWLPSWHVTGRDRDPENAQILRLHFAAPLVRAAAVRVEPGQISEADLMLGDD
jgi:hypothetical protein